LIVGTDYLKDDNLFANERPQVALSGFFPGVDGKLYPTADIQESNRTEGGLITTGVLAGQTFNKDGTLRPFQFGIRGPGAPTSMIGGDSEAFSTNDRRSLVAPIQRANLFVRPSFAVTDNLTLWAEGTYNRLWDERVYWPDFVPNQLTFSRDNPFLSDTIRDQLTAANETTFTMGRALTDVALARYAYSRETLQGSVGLEAKLGGGKWRYNAFFTHCEQTSDQTLKNITLRTNFANAIDAVRAPDGSIVCRVALTDPESDCPPLNLCGSGPSDQAAIDYATANWNSIVKTWLDHSGASISGEPFQLWTRPVSVAAGIEYRKEAFENDFDPNAVANGFSLINGVNIPKTGDTVKEAFAEANIPLLADRPIVQALNFNGAVRVSDYSTSGSIWSWKLGLVWDVMDSLKFRGTRSRDIRAASLTELFSQATTLYGAVNDLGRRGSPSTFAVLRSGGNPNLQPEIADTLTFGAVLTPSFISGFDFSVDYYNIKISDAITALTAQQIVNPCDARHHRR
jgi:iron complex outermembrane receptor protein